MEGEAVRETRCWYRPGEGAPWSDGAPSSDGVSPLESCGTPPESSNGQKSRCGKCALLGLQWFLDYVMRVCRFIDFLLSADAHTGMHAFFGSALVLLQRLTCYFVHAYQYCAALYVFRYRHWQLVWRHCRTCITGHEVELQRCGDGEAVLGR